MTTTEFILDFIKTAVEEAYIQNVIEKVAEGFHLESVPESSLRTKDQIVQAAKDWIDQSLGYNTQNLQTLSNALHQAMTNLPAIGQQIDEVGAATPEVFEYLKQKYPYYLTNFWDTVQGIGTEGIETVVPVLEKGLSTGRNIATNYIDYARQMGAINKALARRAAAALQQGYNQSLTNAPTVSNIVTRAKEKLTTPRYQPRVPDFSLPEIDSPEFTKEY